MAIQARRIVLNIQPNTQITARVNISQYDVGVPIEFELMDGDLVASLPSGATAKVHGTRPSGVGFSQACTINDNILTVYSTTSMSGEAGQIPAEVVIEYSGDVIGTANFFLNVERSPHKDGTIDSDIIIQAGLVERVETLEDEVDQNTGDITDLEGEVSDLKEDLENIYSQEYDGTTVASGNLWFDFPIVAGRTYIFENHSNYNMVAHTLAQASGYDYIEQIGGGTITGNGTATFTATQDAGAIVVWASGAGNFNVYAKDSFSNLRNDIGADDDVLDAKILKLQNAIVTGSAGIDVSLELEQGGINGGNGANQSSSTDIRCVDIIYGDGTYDFYPHGQKVYVFNYDANGAYINASEWGVTSDFTKTLSSGNGFRFATKRADGTAFTPDDNAMTISLRSALGNLANIDKSFQPYSLCKMISHQGYPIDGTFGYCLASQYIVSAQRGFVGAEGDLKFTSDGIPVLCHDDTFTDGTSGDTITISATTYANLLTHNYHGSVVASLDEVLGICKQYGMIFYLDQFSYANNSTKQTAVFDVVKKHGMEDYVFFVTYATDETALIDDIYNWYPEAKIIINANNASYTDTAVTRANAYSDKFSEIVIGMTYETSGLDATVQKAITVNGAKDLGLKLMVWMSDALSWITPFLPYADYYVSNKISNKDLII